MELFREARALTQAGTEAGIVKGWVFPGLLTNPGFLSVLPSYSLGLISHSGLGPPTNHESRKYPTDKHTEQSHGNFPLLWKYGPGLCWIRSLFLFLASVGA